MGSLAATFAAYPHLEAVLPAMGYGEAQRRDLAATINACECDAVISGTPFALDRIVEVRHPVRRASYAFAELDDPGLAGIVGDLLRNRGLGAGSRPGPHSARADAGLGVHVDR